MNPPFLLSASVESTLPDRDFAHLIFEHGPMVRAVCRRILPRREDAEDASQATFLVLARRGGSLRDETRLAAWLHRVATRCAWKLHRKVSARARMEASLETIAEPASAAAPEEDWQAALDAELDRLPDRYRVALALCYLEGRSYQAAAAELGLTRAGLKIRLERGRSLLRARLHRRGLQTAAILAALGTLRPAPAAAGIATAWGAPSPGAMALGRQLSRQLAFSAAAARLLPLAACLALAFPMLGASQSPTEPASGSSSRPARSSAPAPEAQPAPSAAAAARMSDEYPCLIPWQKVSAEFAAGDEITILEIRGTKPNFEPGSRYLVHGRYRLASVARAKLAFFMSATGADAIASGEEPTQAVNVLHGAGEFTLSRYFECAGDPHISFYNETGASIGGVYFSDGMPPKPEPARTLEERLQEALEIRREPSGLSAELIQLKMRADSGDRAAALDLAGRELARPHPDVTQAYRWLYVAGEFARAEEALSAMSPDQRKEALRLTAAYVQRPTGPRAR